MGTNFYLEPPDLAGIQEPLHIGKRSGAGGGLCSWSLQGIRNDVDAPIDSWAKWRAIVRLGGNVVDEYGRYYEAEDFIAEVESTTPENRARQYRWVQDHLDDWWVAGHAERCWLDADGFSFTWDEFS